VAGVARVRHRLEGLPELRPVLLLDRLRELGERLLDDGLDRIVDRNRRFLVGLVVLDDLVEPVPELAEPVLA